MVRGGRTPVKQYGAGRRATPASKQVVAQSTVADRERRRHCFSAAHVRGGRAGAGNRRRDDPGARVALDTFNAAIWAWLPDRPRLESSAGSIRGATVHLWNAGIFADRARD